MPVFRVFFDFFFLGFSFNTFATARASCTRNDLRIRVLTHLPHLEPPYARETVLLFFGIRLSSFGLAAVIWWSDGEWVRW